MITHQLDPSTNSIVSMKLYRNVKHVPQLRKEIISGSLKCCIVKPSLIVNPFQVVIAANKAVVAKKMTTKTIYTELLFNLSISKNITQSLQKFGVDDSEHNMIVVVIAKTNEQNNADEVFKRIEGDEIDMAELKQLTNEKEIKKVYKLSDVELERFALVDSVISKIAVKDFI